MGYYSHYDLNVEGPAKELKQIMDLLEKADDYHKEYYEVGNAYFEHRQESTKWYDYQDDMKRFSLLFPNTLFKLQREGEEAGDLEMSYYKNGKSQVCKAKITFDEYDPEKLT